MPTLHFSKDDRIEHFHIFGYFKEYTDKKTKQYLGHQLLQEIDSETKMGAESMTTETLTKNTKLKSGFKEITIEASVDTPLEVDVFYHFACGRTKK